MSEQEVVGSVEEVPVQDVDVQDDGSSVVPEGQEQAAAPVDANTEAKIRALDKRYDDHVVEIVVDGEKRAMTVGELKKVKQLEAASNKRFQEASEKEKRLMSFLESKRERPEELLATLGVDPDEWAERRLERMVKLAQMDPEQRAFLEQKERFEEDQKVWQAEAEQRVRHEIDRGITDAFKETGLPKTPFLVARLAAIVRQSNEMAIKDPRQKPISFQDAAVMVKEWYREGIRQTLTQLPPEALSEYLGDEFLTKLRQHQLSQVGTPIKARAAGDANPNEEAPKRSSKQKEKPKFTKSSDYMNWVMEQIK